MMTDFYRKTRDLTEKPSKNKEKRAKNGEMGGFSPLRIFHNFVFVGMLTFFDMYGIVEP